MASSLAASAIPALVMARGHRIDNLAEVPLVVDNKVIDNVDKSSKAVALLKTLNAYDDVMKAKDSVNIRAGKGKARNRRYVSRRGPLVIYSQENTPMVKAFRNVAGVDLCNVSRLNVLQLAPGGHLGRFVIWTKDAFERLDSIYGTYTKVSQTKKDYRLPRPLVSNPDLNRLIDSEEIQSVIRAPRKTDNSSQKKTNPLINRAARVKLNPAYGAFVRNAQAAEATRAKKRAAILEQKRKGTKVAKNPKVVAKKKALVKRLAQQRKQFVQFISK